MTKIEWTHRPGTTGETWNPVTGCTKISEGCRNCYAERMSKRLAGRFGYPEDDPFRVTLHPDRLKQWERWKKPRTVFVVSMGDLFHEAVPGRYIQRVWTQMELARDHTFLVLTKRPNRMHKLLETIYYRPEPVPPNVWLGVTAENQQRANERIPLLLQTPAAVRFVSVEPMLKPVSIGTAVYGMTAHWTDPAEMLKLHWVIVGGETGPGARQMDPNWARNIRDQCKAAGVPFFFKQMSNKAGIPADLLIRQWPQPARSKQLAFAT